MLRFLRLVVAGSLDVLLVLGAAAVSVILLTGGGEGQVGPLVIRAYTYKNLILIALPVLGLRYGLRGWGPFLGIASLSLDGLPGAAGRLVAGARTALLELDERRARRIVLVVIACSFVLKTLNAWTYFGFYCGDDVEIQEMSFARLFGWSWRAWELRSPFYPLAFLFPAQRLLVWLGIRDPAVLVFAGRLVVVCFSSLNLYLVYRIARKVFGSLPPAVLAVLFLALSKLHVAFASTELPRTVASSFVLLTCLLLLQHADWWRLAVAGAALAVSACIRFSEVLFALPAAGLLAGRGWLARLARFSLPALLVAAVILGPIDALYWGEPFFSLRHIVDLTLVQRASTRGFQPWHEYVTGLGGWTDVVTFGLFLAAFRFRPRTLLPWAIWPLVLLSVLPHKEPRYLIPALPFVTTSAAWVAWNLIRTVGDRSGDGERGSGPARWALPLVVALCTGALLEVDGFRFRRSESGVELARYVAGRGGPGPIAVEQSWKAGGSLYLWPLVLEDIDPARVDDPGYLLSFLGRRDLAFVGLRGATVRRHGYEELLRSAGFTEVAFSTRRQRAEYRLFERLRPGGGR